MACSHERPVWTLRPAMAWMSCGTCRSGSALPSPAPPCMVVGMGRPPVSPGLFPRGAVETGRPPADPLACDRASTGDRRPPGRHGEQPAALDNGHALLYDRRRPHAAPTLGAGPP